MAHPRRKPGFFHRPLPGEEGAGEAPDEGPCMGQNFVAGWLTLKHSGHMQLITTYKVNLLVGARSWENGGRIITLGPLGFRAGGQPGFWPLLSCGPVDVLSRVGAYTWL